MLKLVRNPETIGLALLVETWPVVRRDGPPAIVTNEIVYRVVRLSIDNMKVQQKEMYLRESVIQGDTIHAVLAISPQNPYFRQADRINPSKRDFRENQS